MAINESSLTGEEVENICAEDFLCALIENRPSKIVSLAFAISSQMIIPPLLVPLLTKTQTNY